MTSKIFFTLSFLSLVLTLRYVDNLNNINYLILLFGCFLFFFFAGLLYEPKKR